MPSRRRHSACTSLTYFRRHGNAKDAVHQVERFADNSKGAEMRIRIEELVLQAPRSVLLQIVHDQSEAGDVRNVDHGIRAGGRGARCGVAHVHDGRDEQRRSRLVDAAGEFVLLHHLIVVQVEHDQLRCAYLGVAELAGVEHPQAAAFVDLNKIYTLVCLFKKKRIDAIFLPQFDTPK